MLQIYKQIHFYFYKLSIRFELFSIDFTINLIGSCGKLNFLILVKLFYFVFIKIISLLKLTIKIFRKPFMIYELYLII